jgi:uncharacterized repeat protein (TIGR02543 family)
MLVLAVLGFGLLTFKQSHATDITVSNLAGLVAAINGAPTNGTPFTIAIDKSFDITSATYIGGGRNIVLTSSDSEAPITLTRGAMYNGNILGVNTTTPSRLTLKNIIIDGNGQPSGHGGMSIYVSGAMHELTVSDGAVVQNGYRNDGAGGAIAISGPIPGTINIKGDAKVINNQTSEEAGAIYVGGASTLNISDSSEISGNAAVRAGGAILVGSGSTLNISGDVKISSNQSGSHGGAIAAPYSATVMINDNVEISGNQTNALSTNGGVGGGIFFQGGTLNINGGRILRNRTNDSNGAGVYIENGSGVGGVRNALIADNQSGRNGGGMMINEGDDVVLEHVIFDNNSAANGAGLMMGGNIDAGQITISNCQFVDNTARGNGGAIGVSHNQLDKLFIDAKTIFSKNTAQFSTHMSIHDQSLYNAQVAANQFSLTFNGYNNYDVQYPLTNKIDFDVGIDDATAVDDQYLLPGEMAVEPTVLTNNDYYFDGWFISDANLTSPYDFSQPVNSAMALYAKWTAKPRCQYNPTFLSDDKNCILSTPKQPVIPAPPNTSVLW